MSKPLFIVVVAIMAVVVVGSVLNQKIALQYNNSEAKGLSGKSGLPCLNLGPMASPCITPPSTWPTPIYSSFPTPTVPTPAPVTSCTEGIYLNNGNTTYNSFNSSTTYTDHWQVNGNYSELRLRVGTNRSEVEDGCPSGSHCVAAVTLPYGTSGYTITGLTPNTNYWNRVAALCQNPNLTWAWKDVIWQATTTNTPSHPSVNSVQPNRIVHGQSTRIVITGSDLSQVYQVIGPTDVMGPMIYGTFSKPHITSSTQLEFNATVTANGQHRFQLLTNDGQRTTFTMTIVP